jgi:hypothetical protein
MGTAKIISPNMATDQPSLGWTTVSFGGSEASGMPAANLQTVEPSELGRITKLCPIHTFVRLAMATFTTDVDAIALVNSNLSRFAKVRYASAGSVAAPFTTALAPNALAGSVNLSGAYTDIDEAQDAPDSAYIGPSVAANTWSTRVQFPTPASDLKTGADLQCFVLYARTPDAAFGVKGELNVQLYENGTPLGTQETRYITHGGWAGVPDGQYIIVTWDASLLSSIDGSNVECFVQGNRDGDYDVRVEVDLVAWNAELASTTVTNDSGWLDAGLGGSADPLWGSMWHEHAGADPQQILRYFPAATWQDVSDVYVLIRDDFTDTEDGTGIDALAGTALPTYIQAGVFVAGPAFGPARNIAPGPSIGIMDRTLNRTLGGQSYGTSAHRYRDMELEFRGLIESEGFSLFDMLDWRKGMANPVFVAVDSEATSYHGKHTALWATITRAGRLQPMAGQAKNPGAAGEQLYSKRYSLSEKL